MLDNCASLHVITDILTYERTVRIKMSEKSVHWFLRLTICIHLTVPYYHCALLWVWPEFVGPRQKTAVCRGRRAKVLVGVGWRHGVRVIQILLKLERSIVVSALDYWNLPSVLLWFSRMPFVVSWNSLGREALKYWNKGNGTDDWQ